MVPVEAYGQVKLVGKWDRLNPEQSNPTPEHEVLRCGGKARWHRIYDKHPEPNLGYENPPDSIYGHFQGKNITSGWTCPGWFPADICDNTKFVVGGMMEFVQSVGSEPTVAQELILTDIGGESILYVYWVNHQFACPWYRGFDEVLAANPFPTPFKGEEWPAIDCVFSP